MFARFNKQDERGKYRDDRPGGRRQYLDQTKGVLLTDVWSDIMSFQQASTSQERLGYPTQKPLALLERIITASSNRGDLVLDPFCGCGTTLHAAEKLNRRWIGIDISRYAASLVKNRLLGNFDKLNDFHIDVFGLPTTVEEARALATGSLFGRFEFEKWVCGVLGTANMIHRSNPGEPGADGGVDGLLRFFPIAKKAVTTAEGKIGEKYAVVQVKSGKVTPDAVRALTQVIEDVPGAVAAVLVAFDEYRTTFERNASKVRLTEYLGDPPKVQFMSIDELLALPDLPTYLPNITKLGGRSESVKLPKTETLEGQLALDKT